MMALLGENEADHPALTVTTGDGAILSGSKNLPHGVMPVMMNI